MGKDQTIGVLIFVVCLLLAVAYIATLFAPGWLGLIGISAAEADAQFWVVAVPVFVAFVGIMGIGAWIGWTMATTPPPQPIEEIESESQQVTGAEASEN